VTEAHASDLPILGEHAPVDFANSWYEHPGGVIDHLADPAGAARYLLHLSWDEPLALPRRLTSPQAADLRGLRDAIRRLLFAVVDEAQPRYADLAIVNRAGGRGRVAVGLEWTPERGPVARRRVRGSQLDTVVVHLALGTIELVTNRATSIRRCAHPSCTMLFVQDHHRRRFCTPGCSHRDRQHRYATSFLSPESPNRVPREHAKRGTVASRDGRG
jgi:predicted RNA-binding Zn ribbon-like protein